MNILKCYFKKQKETSSLFRFINIDRNKYRKPNKKDISELLNIKLYSRTRAKDIFRSSYSLKLHEIMPIVRWYIDINDFKRNLGKLCLKQMQMSLHLYGKL